MAKEEHFDHPPRGHVAVLAYDPDNDRFRVLEIESDAAPHLLVRLAAGALQAHVGYPNSDDRPTNYGSLLVISHLYGYDGSGWDRVHAEGGNLNINPHGYDGSAWRKLPLTWGFYDTISEAVADTNLSGGASTVGGTPVPSDEVWVISTITAYIISATMTVLLVGPVVDGVVLSPIAYQPPTQNIWYAVSGQYILGPGDYIQGTVGGATAGDDLYFRYCGYKMKINL